MTVCAVLVVLLLAGCGGSVDQTKEQRAAEQALKLWGRFSAGRVPRPVVLIGDSSVLAPGTGFGTGDAKLADLEGRFVLRARLPEGPGELHGRPVISARKAIGWLSSDSGKGPPVAPLAITGVKLGWASFSTDRGPRTLPAWAFSLAGVLDPTYVLALTGPDVFASPATKQLLASEVGGYEEDHATVSGNGRLIRLSFIGGPAGRRPCDISYTVEALADSHAVAFWITAHPVKTHGNAPVFCATVGYNRTVALHLNKPIGGRVLIDAASAGPVPVDPAVGAH
jgi:hypothetical protein